VRENKISVAVNSENRPTVHITQPRDGGFVISVANAGVRVEVLPISLIDRDEFFMSGELSASALFF